MASLSDQINRLSRNTRSIADTATAIAPPTASTAFTRAVLSSHIGDLIRDIDPSELGLFRLESPPSASPYDGTATVTQDAQVRRIDFPTATPLRKNTTRREDKHEFEPEVYAHAALKYIDRYEPIRPMPRAYDQIVTILNHLNAVRANIDVLSKELKKVESVDKGPPTKTRIAEEEGRIKELQARIAELQKQKENASKPAPKPKQTALPKPAQPPPPPKAHVTSSSPQEDKFWANKGEPSRILRFSENLLDEEVNLGDVSSSSFGTPLGPIPRLKILGDLDDVTIAQFPPRKWNGRDDNTPIVIKDAAAETLPLSEPKLPPAVAQPTTPPPPPAETPTSRQRKVKLNIELDRIVAKIWATVGDIIAPHIVASPLSIPDTISYLKELAEQTPSPDSPTALSSASSAVADGIPPKPNAQQIQYAHMVMLLISSAPHYSMPLNELKEHLATKAKMAGGTSRVLFQCIAKRLVKIDRSSGEQIVKFDI